MRMVRMVGEIGSEVLIAERLRDLGGLARRDEEGYELRRSLAAEELLNDDILAYQGIGGVK